jgi:hypothetical protein
MRLLEQVLLWVHGLSAAAWFGAILYRTVTVDPKAFGFFADRADYERYSVHLAHGMRYVVWAGLSVCGLSGFMLAGLRWDPANGVWLGLMAAKLAVWLAALLVFVYVSYVHWPWRSVSVAREYAGYRREAFVLAGCMVLFSGTGFLLGQACRLTAG